MGAQGGSGGVSGSGGGGRNKRPASDGGQMQPQSKRAKKGPLPKDFIYRKTPPGTPRPESPVTAADLPQQVRDFLTPPSSPAVKLLGNDGVSSDMGGKITPSQEKPPEPPTLSLQRSTAFRLTDAQSSFFSRELASVLGSEELGKSDSDSAISGMVINREFFCLLNQRKKYVLSNFSRVVRFQT